MAAWCSDVSRVPGSMCRRRHRGHRGMCSARYARSTLHAAITSAAGSPTPTPPKSITALNRPSSNEHVGPQQVTVYPDRRAFPRRCCRVHAPRRRWPHRRLGRPATTRSPRALTASSSRSGLRPPRGARGGIYPTQLERRTAARSRAAWSFIVDEFLRIRLAVDPPVDRPGEGVGARRIALPNRLGNPQRQVRSELREPMPLLLQVPCPLAPRAAVARRGGRRAGRSRSPSPWTSLADRQVGQLGELRGDQPLTSPRRCPPRLRASSLRHKIPPC